MKTRHLIERLETLAVQAYKDGQMHESLLVRIRKANEQLADRDRRIEELEKLCNPPSEAKLADELAVVDNLRRERDELQEALHKANDRIGFLEEDLANVRKELASVNRDRDRLRAERLHASISTVEQPR